MTETNVRHCTMKLKFRLSVILAAPGLMTAFSGAPTKPSPTTLANKSGKQSCRLSNSRDTPVRIILEEPAMIGDDVSDIKTGKLFYGFHRQMVIRVNKGRRRC